ncbi:hypothetical protein Tco_1414239, partial [Tanacetum coccineum]
MTTRKKKKPTACPSTAARNTPTLNDINANHHYDPNVHHVSPSSSLPLVDDERPNGIRPLKIQRPTPLIDVVAARDKSK